MFIYLFIFLTIHVELVKQEQYYLFSVIMPG